jgi:nucleoside-diphosphate-sugar epimerase
VAKNISLALTGSTGLIGSAFLEQLPEGVEVTKLLPFRFMKSSEITPVIEELSTLGTRLVLHLGWPASSSLENYRYSAENFEALEKTIILKDACLRNNISFIGIGTVLDKENNQENIYQQTKFICRKIFESEIHNQVITWIRPYFVFNNSHWPDFIHSRQLVPVEIEDNTPRDFIHINDVVSALFAVIQNGITGEIDLGSGRLTSPSEVCRSLGKKYQLAKDSVAITETTFFSPAQLNPVLTAHWSPTTTKALFKENR